MSWLKRSMLPPVAARSIVRQPHDPDALAKEDDRKEWDRWWDAKTKEIHYRKHLSAYLAGALLLLDLLKIGDLLHLLRTMSPAEGEILFGTSGIIVTIVWRQRFRGRIKGYWWRDLLSKLVFSGLAFGIVLCCFQLVTTSKDLRESGGRVATLILVVLTTIGACVAAWWEVRGDKLATSPRDTEFLLGIRDLLEDQRSYFQMATPDDNKFVQTLLSISQLAMCGHLKVEAVFGVRATTKQDMTLRTLSGLDTAKYIKLVKALAKVHEDAAVTTGINAEKFNNHVAVYVPDNRLKEAWLVGRGKGGEYHDGDAPLKNVEDLNGPFRAVLSVPIWLQQDKSLPAAEQEETDAKRKKLIGMIVFVTQRADPFLARDWTMGECFAGLSSQGELFKARLNAKPKP